MTDRVAKSSKSPQTGQKDGKSRKKKLFAKRPLFKMQYYFTKGHEHVGPARNVNDEQSPFLFPPCSLLFAYFQYWKARKRMADLERRGGCGKKQGGGETSDLLRRLRVDVDIEAIEAKKHKDLDEAIAITDVDPEFFTELSGRRVKEKFSVQDYVNDTREVFKLRLLAGQEMDDCIRIEQQFVEEQRTLDRIRRRYRQYVSGFEEFLSKDHESSMKILKEADEEAKITRQLTETRNELTKEFGQVRLEVYMWEENWRLVKMCQRFLYQVAPISWRAEHDWIHRVASGETVASGSGDDLFGRFKAADAVESLDTMIELFERDIELSGPADMYFTDPFDLIRVFKSIEMQNLSAMLHLESLAEPMNEMMVTLATAEEHIKTEVSELNVQINDVLESIHTFEARATELENYANMLLESVFRDSVCSEEVLRLQVFIEDAYESCVAPNDANLDSFSMMKWIEKSHEELNLELDTLPPEVVQICEREGFKQELKAMKETEEAARKFELMHRLIAALQRVMAPPKMKTRPLRGRSPPSTRKVKEIPPPPEPTEEEMQYLTFFTKYCRQEDFTEYYSEFPDDFDLSFQPQRKETVEDDEDTSDDEEKKSEEDDVSDS